MNVVSALVLRWTRNQLVSLVFITVGRNPWEPCAAFGDECLSVYGDRQLDFSEKPVLPVSPPHRVCVCV